jgi:hypothetical protein
MRKCAWCHEIDHNWQNCPHFHTDERLIHDFLRQPEEKETPSMAWPPKTKTTDSLGVVAEVIINATYGELIRLAESLSAALPAGAEKDKKAVAEALHQWAQKQTAATPTPLINYEKETT